MTTEITGGDGQPKTAADLPANLFVLERRNRPFISGQSRTPYLKLTGCMLIVMVLIGAVVLALIAANQVVLAFCPGIFLIVLVFGVVNDTVRRVRLTFGGQLLVGQVVSANGQWIERSGSRPTESASRSIRNYQVTIQYRLKTPSGNLLNITHNERRYDLANRALPTPGTPIAVLYRTDDDLLLL
jgi:hypothetical protein